MQLDVQPKEAGGPEGPCSLILDIHGAEKRTGAEAKVEAETSIHLLLSPAQQIPGTSTASTVGIRIPGKLSWKLGSPQ